MISSNIKRSLLTIAAFGLLVLATGFDQPPHQILDEDDMVSDSAADAASQQSIKKYVDDSIGSIIIVSDADGDTKIQVEESPNENVIRFDIAGSQEFSITVDGAKLALGVRVSEFSSDVTFAGDSDLAVPTEKAVKAFVTSGTITMSAKTLTSPVLNTGISGTAFLDEDDMVSDSANKLASQQSIKKYVDDNAGTPTKEFFVKTGNQSGVGILDDWIFVSLGSTASALYTFIVPNDFVSLAAAVVVIIPDATEMVQWDNDVSVAAAGEDYNADARQSLNETKAVTVNDLTELDVSATLTGLAAGDYVALRFQSDTATIRALGLRIKYN